MLKNEWLEAASLLVLFAGSDVKAPFTRDGDSQTSQDGEFSN